MLKLKKLCVVVTVAIFLFMVFFIGYFIKQKNKVQNTNSENKVQASTASKNKSVEKNGSDNKKKTEQESKKEDKVQQQEKVQNVSKKVVVIDPGHGNRSNLEKEPLSPESNEMKIKDGGGAEGVNTKTPEYKVNMSVSMKLKQILEQKGYVVKMTKTEDSQSPGNVERAKVGNEENAALVIRIHADSSESSQASGASMLVPAAINDNTKKIYAESKNYGTIILKDLVNEVGMSNRGVVERSDMTGFNWSQVPVVLIEMGFLSNPQEEKMLCEENYQMKIANGLADGINDALK